MEDGVNFQETQVSLGALQKGFLGILEQPDKDQYSDHLI